MLGRDKGAHVAAAQAVAGAQGIGALGNLGHEFVGDFAHGQQGRDRHAAFARRSETGIDGGVGSHVEIGVGQDDHVVLRSAKGLDTLSVRRGGLIDVLGDRGGADKGNSLNVRVGEEGVDGHLVAVQDVEDAVRQAGFFPEFGHPVHGRGILFAGFDDDGVAGGDGKREEPHRHMAGKLNGLMIATGPRAWRMEWTSTLVDAFSV